MYKPKNTAILVILAVVALSVNGQLAAMRFADPDPSTISAQAGETINLLCRYPAAITSCNFRVPGDPSEIKLNPAWTRTDNYRYFGKSLSDGECGITISNVNENMHGQASCRLDLNDGLADAFANISVVIAKAPQDPRIDFENPQDFYQAGDDIVARCESVDGRPAASLSWFLGEKPLGPGSIEITDSENTDAVYSTAVSTLHFRLKPEDNNQRLICTAAHVGFQDGARSTAHQLVVRFRPIPQSEIRITGLEIGSSANIGPITILANPRPKIQWLVDGNVMEEGSQNDRFIVRSAVGAGEAKYNVTLQAVSLSLEDTTRQYVLRASNEFGTTDYKVRIGGSSEVAGTGLSIVTIIAISIISLFVLVVVALIVVARVTKRWCFAGDSMHPNGPDSEAQIAPEEDKNHEHYEQHEKSADEEPEPETGNGEGIKATNGKAKGNTSV